MSRRLRVRAAPAPFARATGALVIGFASLPNHDFLVGLGITPVDSVYVLGDVAAAYRRLAAGNLRGKIVLRTGSIADAAALLRI